MGEAICFGNLKSAYCGLNKSNFSSIFSFIVKMGSAFRLDNLKSSYCGLNTGPSVYETDALPLRHRSVPMTETILTKILIRPIYVGQKMLAPIDTRKSMIFESDQGV